MTTPAVSPVLNGGTYSLWNVQDELQAQPGTFEARVLSHPAVTAVFGNARQREKLYKACRGQIEAHAGDFTRRWYRERAQRPDGPGTCSSRGSNFGGCGARSTTAGHSAPRLATIGTNPNGSQSLTVNINLVEPAKVAGPGFNLHLGVPLSGIAASNRLLQSASSLRSDLYSPWPMSGLVGDKLLRCSDNRED